MGLSILDPGILGAIIGASTTFVVSTGGWAYGLWLRRQQDKKEQGLETAAALRVQLEGWTNYAEQLSNQIGKLQHVISEKDDRIAALERARSKYEEQITKLWQRIREMDDGIEKISNQ